MTGNVLSRIDIPGGQSVASVITLDSVALTTVSTPTPQIVSVVNIGIKGDPSPPPASSITSVKDQRIAGVNLSGHRAVTLDSANQLVYADAQNIQHAPNVIGITTGAVSQGYSCQFQTFGELTEPSWNFDITKPVYLAQNGNITQTVPTSGSSAFSLVIGFATSPTKLFVRIAQPITLI